MNAKFSHAPTICPTCGHLINKDQTPAPAITIDEIVSFCRENNIPIFAGQRVSPSGASRVLNVSLGTLANWRSTLSGPNWVRTGNGRCSYKISALSEFYSHQFS
jgi:hypothetical protein